jgi:two-component system LytT family sensor kinase
MSLLKSQINPHFLFNTLNSISTLIHFSKDKARKMITQLSDMFRYAMDSYDDQLVELTEEMHFIDNYIRIQQVRFEDRLVFIKEIEEECLKTKIPPMILQPLIENAVKYGVGPKDEGGTIKLIAKRIVGGGVYFEVRDNGLGVNAPKVLDGSSSGIGMQNSEKRLQNIYGAATTFKVVSNTEGYKVSFIILNKKIKDNEYIMLDR